MKKKVKITLIILCALILVLCGTALALYSFGYMGFEDGKLKFYFGQKDETPDEPVVPEEPEDTRFAINLVWMEGGKEQVYRYDPVTSTFSPKIQETWAKLSTDNGQPYRFDNWYTDELYHDIADPKSIRDGDTLYAKMIEQVTVTIHNIYPGNKDTKQEVAVDKYSIFSIDNNLSLTTAEFFGVYKDSNKSETATDFQASANSEIYAYWSSKYSDFKWETDSSTKTAKITEYKGSSKYVVIPTAYVKNKTNFTVTEIGDEAFEDSDITSIEIPNSVTSIGYRAFEYCAHLTSITIPNSVTSIGECAFQYCSGLTNVTIPNSVTSIGSYAFSNCSGLTSVTIPDGVTSIGYDAFNGCTNLTPSATEGYIKYLGNSSNPYVYLWGVTDKTQSTYTINSNCKIISDFAFADCSGLTSITIPNSVTSIYSWAFQNCASLTSVTIGNSVTSISSWTFDGCTGLTSITIQATTPPNLMSHDPFLNCPNITNIYVPAGSVKAYKFEIGWSSYADKIQAIQE